MNEARITELSGISQSDLETIKAEIGDDNYERITRALGNLENYVNSAVGRGVGPENLKYNVPYHIVRLYAQIRAKNEGEREPIARELIKMVVEEEATRSQLYVDLFDRGGVHETLTMVRRPA